MLEEIEKIKRLEKYETLKNERERINTFAQTINNCRTNHEHKHCDAHLGKTFELLYCNKHKEIIFCEPQALTFMAPMFVPYSCHRNNRKILHSMEVKNDIGEEETKDIFRKAQELMLLHRIKRPHMFFLKLAECWLPHFSLCDNAEPEIISNVNKLSVWKNTYLNKDEREKLYQYICNILSNFQKQGYDEFVNTILPNACIMLRNRSNGKYKGVYVKDFNYGEKLDHKAKCCDVDLQVQLGEFEGTVPFLVNGVTVDLLYDDIYYTKNKQNEESLTERQKRELSAIAVGADKEVCWLGDCLGLNTICNAFAQCK